MITVVAMDVDGTLTDGTFFMDGEGHEFKAFNVHDGYGIVQLKKAGLEVVWISGRSSKATMQRAADLGVSRVVNGTGHKLEHLLAIAREFSADASQIAYIGDDIPDLECIEWAGLGIAPADSVPEVIAAADYVTTRPGGRGAVREAARHILEYNGRSGI